MNWIKKQFEDVLRLRYPAIGFSGVILLVCLLGVIFQGGLLYGIDFTGGLKILLEFSDPLGTEKMSEIRSKFSEKFSSTKVQSVSLSGESDRRGLMLTVRASGTVERLTDKLINAGRTGNKSVFDKKQSMLLPSSLLKENFSLTGENDGMNLSQASRKEVNSRVQSLVNQNISKRVLEILRSEFVSASDGIDLNWATAEEIQSWLANQQANTFVERIDELKSNNNLSSSRLTNLLDTYGIAESSFLDIFRLGSGDPDLLNLRKQETEDIREIVYPEFFQGEYESQAEKIIEQRNDEGIFKTSRDVLNLSVMDQFPESSLKNSFSLSPFIIKSREMISPSIGSELITDAALAILLSLLGILVYLYVRFELHYSFGAVSAIIHDVFITVGLLTLLGVEFNIPVVAAVLTVIGYSLNDTIVNFDRVRENRVLMGHQAEWYDIINRSVVEVLNRTFVTSITTFISAIVLYIYGGIALQGFALTLIIGVISGTYSSIFVSNVVLFELQENF